MDGHFVTVVGVQNSVPRDASGFSIWVADSESGRVLRVFIYAGQNQDSPALATNRRSGQEAAPQTPHYLMIQSPKLEDILTGHAAESQRTICVLQYIVHR